MHHDHHRHGNNIMMAGKTIVFGVLFSVRKAHPTMLSGSVPLSPAFHWELPAY
jgi:hypothetical protein